MEASVCRELCRHMCIHRYQGLSYANFRKHASNVAAPHDAAQDQSARLVSHLPSVAKNLRSGLLLRIPRIFPRGTVLGSPALPSHDVRHVYWGFYWQTICQDSQLLPFAILKIEHCHSLW